MTPEELRGQLQISGIACRIEREEVVAETCRFCGNTHWNLDMNAAKGTYHCWVCDAGGRLDALLRDWLGGNFYIPVRYVPKKKAGGAPVTDFTSIAAHEVAPAKSYLQKRGIDYVTSRSYEIVVCTDAKHPLNGRLVIPIRDFWTQEVIGYIGRSFTGKQPKYLSTLSTRKITGYRASSWNAPCIFVEGFFDGIAVHRAGFHAAVLGGTSSTDVLEFASRLPSTIPRIVMLDGSAKEEANRLKQTLIIERGITRDTPVRLVDLPSDYDPATFKPSVLRWLVKRALTTD
jgi:hypothetical protein